MSLLRLLRRVIGRYRWQVALVVTLTVVQTVANLFLPNLNADIINNGVVKGDISYVWTTGVIMMLVALGVGAVAIVAVYASSRTSMGVGRDLRALVFRSVQRFSAREMNSFGTPSLITRNINDVQQVQLLVQMGLTMMVMAPIMAIGGLAMSIYEGAELSLLLAVVVPLMAVIIAIMVALVVPQFQVMQVKIDRINQVLLEQITGVRVIRAFVRGPAEEARFEDANMSLTRTALRVTRIFAVAMPALMAVLNNASVAVIWFGGHLVDSGQMPIGNLTAFLSYIAQIFFSVMIAVMMIMLLPRAVASAARLEAVLTTETTVRDPDTPVEPPAPTGEVCFEHVTFAYAGSEEDVLHDVTVTFAAGRTTAIIGGTGSGKTTLVNLIPRLFDATAGRVLVDGIDVRSRTLSDLRRRMAVVPQAAYLFGGTIAENLRYGDRQATDDDLWRALEIAQGRDFVETMDGGLAAAIDQGGTNVSGGQRQRLCIARALVRRPDIYVFDDCFSALDAATDARLRRALHERVAGATVIMVSQRVSTVMHADSIVTLDAGRVVGVGSHAELMDSCPEYQEIVESQLGRSAVS